MSLWTRAELLKQIATCKSALAAATLSHSYGEEGRNLTHQRLDDLRKHLAYLEGELAALDRGGRGPIFVQGRVRR